MVIMLALKLPSEVEKRLEKAARGTGRTKASLVREAILRYLDDLEDVNVAIERLEKPGKRWTLAELGNGVEPHLVPRSSARSLVKHTGTWVGDDLGECLREVYAFRGKAKFEGHLD